MRSSKELFLPDATHLQQNSRLISVSGKCGKTLLWKLIGRITEVSEDRLVFGGRGFEVAFLLDNCRFERDKLSKSSIVVLRPSDPGALFRPFWTITWRNRDFIMFSEVPPK